MCKLTLKTYENCTAISEHTSICQTHIAYTLKQLNNHPCPDFMIRTIHRRGNCTCAFDLDSPCIQSLPGLSNEPGKTWEFETVGPTIGGHEERQLENSKSLIKIENERLGDLTAEVKESLKSGAQSTVDMMADAMSKLMQNEDGQRKAKRARRSDRYPDLFSFMNSHLLAAAETGSVEVKNGHQDAKMGM